MVDKPVYPEIRYDFPDGVEPVPGEFSIIGLRKARTCVEKDVCPDLIGPDYSDWFWGVWKDGKTSVTFPNVKEKEYYGYDADKFKGIIGLIPTLYKESYNEKYIDFAMSDLQDHVKMTVNGRPVAKYLTVAKMVIIEDENGSINWQPNENGQYVLEFEAVGVFEDSQRPATEHHLRFSGFVLY